MHQERFDIRQRITDTIVRAIERGAGEFRLPWHRAAGNIMCPVNIASKKAYRGINVVALWAYARNPVTAPHLGHLQAMVRGRAQVRKGAKAAFVVFYKELEFAADSERGDTETEIRLFARATPSLPPSKSMVIRCPVIDTPPATSSRDRAGLKLSSPRPAASVTHDGGRAY